MSSPFELFLNRAFPNWQKLSEHVLNKNLEEVTGIVHLRLRHRRCTIVGIPQITRIPKSEYWLSEGKYVNIPGHIRREWFVKTKNPDGPFVYLKNDPGSLYPIDLVHNLEVETEEETLERRQVEKKERWNALISTANRIVILGKKFDDFDNGKNEIGKRIEKLARRMIQITLNS